MRTTFFFLSSLFVFAGCATNQVSDKNSGDVDPKYFGAYLCSSGSEATALCQFNKSKSISSVIQKRSLPGNSEEPEIVAADVRNAYCSGESPRRSVEEKFSVVIPLPPSGIEINYANELIENFKQTARNRIKQIFMARAPDFDKSLFEEQSPKLPPFILSVRMGQEPIKTFFKAQRLGPKSAANSSGIIALRDGDHVVMGWAPLSITLLEPNFMQNAFHMPDKIGQSVFPESPGWHTTLPRNPRKRLGTGLPQSREALALFERKTFDSNNQVLIYTSWPDLEVMKNYFVLDVPEAEQSKVFKSWPRGYDDRPYNRNVFGGNVEQAFMIRDQSQLWDHYINEFTEVVEETTIDPRVINFKARLDLGWYCKYGRTVHSLKSN